MSATPRPTSDAGSPSAEGTIDPALLNIAALRRYLDERGIGAGDLRVARIGEGQSNLTFLIERGGESFVLRRGPRPPFPPSAHDMVREARVLGAVGGAGFPVPRVVSVCESDDVVGVPFYVMRHVAGDVVTTALPSRFDAPPLRRKLVFAAVDALAALHAVPLEGPLAQIGRPDGYLARQVSRFAALAERDPVRPLPEIARLAGWLRERTPETRRQSVVHGDFRLGNIIYSDDSEPRIAAVLDWEMATAGDPLADLGYLIATYAESGRASTVMELTTVTRGEGFPTRSEVAARYSEQTGSDLESLTWYEVLALWKSAIFCEAIYTRWLRGERPDDHDFGPSLERGVPGLLHAAADLIGG